METDAIFSFLGSALGCVAGILTSQRLTVYRIQQLEEKVNKHNNLVERMTVNEMKIKNIEEKVKCEVCSRD
ncbi:MAG: hypothetical protein J6R20_00675 [Clostridia bacterium]|jgi:hypothetical protein|nr:hypothetical protein [Clostridia bacterium]